MKKIWKTFLAVSLSLCMALDMPLRLPAFSPAAYGAERPASVQATSLNVRSGPGTGYSIVGKLTYGAGVTVVDEAAAADGTAWYRRGGGRLCDGGLLKIPLCLQQRREF